MPKTASPAPTPAIEPVSFDHCIAPSKAYDEAFDASHGLRPHWQSLLDKLTKLGVQGMRDRQAHAQRILRDDGATYNLKSDPLSPNVWALDIIPNVIPEAEWYVLEAGLKQRANLLDLLFKDLYGPQNLIKDGVIPAQIVYSHPGFLRPCHGMELPGVKNLVLHAADVVKDKNGNYLVVGDRTQTPAGAGYALENRTVVSRVMPDLFRDSNVRRIIGFFHTLRRSLSEMMSHNTDNPRIVVLTPGAYSSNYFEHAYLANFLGFPLVQGGDLTVRNGKVWMKSLHGLSQVDVILRRVDDSFCDQAELRADSMLGVPGLLEVARAGNVLIANPLGAGILEAPALMSFLPQICEYLLQEPLRIPSVGSWWCGDQDNLAYVANNLHELIIKPIARSALQKSVYGHTLNEQERTALLATIQENPGNYVAQAYTPGPHLPTWQKGKLTCRPSLLRTFTVADGNDYSVMPGGLSRIATSEQEHIVSILSGSSSKDTWVKTSQAEPYRPLLEEQHEDEAQQTNLPSRVIENLFWFGRYAERAETCLRLMRTLFKQLNGFDPLPIESKRILLHAVSHQTGVLPGFTSDEAELLDAPEETLAALVTDGDLIGSIKSNLHAMLACGEQVKEMLSADTRVILNELRDHIHEVDRAYVNGLPAIPEESLDSLVTSLLALSGLNNESMLRGLDWVFQEIGRRTERALQTTTLLQSTLTQALPSMPQQQVLESVLLSVEALISFRRRYRTRTRVAFGLDLLMIDRTNPRSLIYQVEQLRKYLDALPKPERQQLGLALEQRLIIKSLNDLQLADLEELAQADETTGERKQLTELLTSITEQLEQFTTIISDRYFDHTAGPQQLIKSKWKVQV